jgi:hypothetical protein
VARKRTLILIKVDKDSPGSMQPLGDLRDIITQLSNHNIAPDGSGPAGLGERMGTGVLYGPGLVAEVPLNDDPMANKGRGPEIQQIMVSLTDEDFSFPVLQRACRELGWKMMDPESGRMFG